MYIIGIERDNDIYIDVKSQVELFKRAYIEGIATEK